MATRSLQPPVPAHRGFRTHAGSQRWMPTLISRAIAALAALLSHPRSLALAGRIATTRRSIHQAMSRPQLSHPKPAWGRVGNPADALDPPPQYCERAAGSGVCAEPCQLEDSRSNESEAELDNHQTQPLPVWETILKLTTEQLT